MDFLLDIFSTSIKQYFFKFITGVNRYGTMPGAGYKVATINGEKEKNKENGTSSNKSEEKDDNDFEVIAESRVRNTLNGIGQGIKHFASKFL